VLSGHGTWGGPALGRNGSEDVLQGELISRRELGDDLVVTPRHGTLRGHRTDISVVGGPETVLWGGGGDGRGMSDGDAHGLSGTFRPGHVLVEASDHVVRVRWQPAIDGDGRSRAAVEGAWMVHGLGILEQPLVLSTGRMGRGRGGEGGMELGEGRIVN
jgi:hypothetical protein